MEPFPDMDRPHGCENQNIALRVGHGLAESVVALVPNQ